jgi:hypothetical protein
MIRSIIQVPFSPGLTLAACMIDFEGNPISATGIAQSCLLANRLAESEIQERIAACAAPFQSDIEGLAAGTNYKIAAARAKAELLERMAVHQWWYEGAALGKALASDQRALDKVLLLYRRKSPRCVKVAELAVAPPLTIIIVWSHDNAGQGICLGFGASHHRHAAIYKALRELVQMEFSLGIILTKQRTKKKLCPREESVLDRAAGLRTDAHPVLWSFNGSSTVLSSCKIVSTRLHNPIGNKVVVRATFSEIKKCSVDRTGFRQWRPY